MSEETKQVLQMLNEGKITAAEATSLIKALAESTPKGDHSVDEMARRARLQAKVLARKTKETLKGQLHDTAEVIREQLHGARETMEEAVKRVQEEARADYSGGGGLGSILGNFLRSFGGSSFTWQDDLSGEIDSEDITKVSIRGVNGRIEVGASPDDKWHLSVEKSVYAEDRDEAREQAKQMYSVEKNKEGLFIAAKQVFGQRSAVHFRLLWPLSRCCDLDLLSVNGSIKVKHDVLGVVRVTTTNGKVEVQGDAEEVSLSSTNGRILFLGCAAMVACSTINGGISLVCKEPREGAWSLKTVNGSIRGSVGESKDIGMQCRASNVHGRVECNLPDLVVEVKKGAVGKSLWAVPRGNFTRHLAITATSVHGSISIDPWVETVDTTKA
ncbi:MAG: hypothetical protein KGZ92_11145 [Firmicutes bacterium]|nr:hypothetical protein [Dethiobacter sp.]MBS3889819.1 hypothetical protein [Bacillota bacterium]MBS4054328.1 hypothetical protein [Thermaerobacter sp.]